MLGSSNTPAVASAEQASSKSTPPRTIRTRDKIRHFLHLAKPDAQSRTRTPPPEKEVHHKQGAIIESGNNINTASCTVKVSSHETATQLTRTTTTTLCCNIFTENVGRPSNVIKLQKPGERIDTTPQLALCSSLMQQEISADMPADKEHRDWIKSISQNQVEQDHIRWLLTRMIEEFAKDAVKGSSAIKEIVLLSPVLDREHYRSLLSSFITKFDQTTILDVDLLRGLVQLVQCASAEYLVEDDLVKIMSILRTCLQKTHQQSSVHLYNLTLALSRILDVMAKHEVKDVDRVEQHEPLAAILSSLRDSSDPFLMYQAAYAFQALQRIPDDETALQAVMRHSGAVAEGLVNISGIVNLDLGGFLEGIGKVQKTIIDTIGIAKAAYEGTRSLIESGQDVFNAIKGGINSGNKRAWYPAIVGGDALVRQGRLADFKAVVLEASCRSNHEFQWGICQLLGEIALDPVWESAIRQQAVDFLVELHTNDTTWGRDASVKSLMLTIFHLVSGAADQDIKVPAGVNKQNSDSADVKFDTSYPLVSHLPPPEAWSLLSRVQGITNVERDIHRLRTERLEDYNQNVYIPPLAKANLQASDKDAVPLTDKIKEFLENDQQVFLVLGDSGVGKSTFNRHIEHELWGAYKHGDPVPLFINLPAIKQPDQDLIGKQLRIHNFSDPQIQELKQNRRIILICDGYDETQVNDNLHTTNLLNKKGQPDTKMIISCRSSHLGSDYRNQFQPLHQDRYSGITTGLFTEAVIIPFSSVQVEDYVCQFVRDSEVHKLTGDGPIWSTEEYMTKLQSIPNMMELVKNPFLLKLALRTLPQVVKDVVDLANVKVTRLTLYDSFINQWLETNKLRLETSPLFGDAAAARRDLLEDGFVQSAVDFSKDLAAAIFREQDGNAVVQYTSRSDRGTWKAKFFGSQADTTILRESSPLSRAGTQHQFIHRSLLEYFYSRHIYEASAVGSLMSKGSQDVADQSLSQTNLVKEPSIIDFLAEHVKRDPAFKQKLHHIIELSKTDTTPGQAAASAITTLVRAGVTFNGADLQGIRIPGADLSGGEFDSAQLQGADLSNTNLRNIWLRQADLSNAQMAGAQFGEWPLLEEEYVVYCCAYSPDGKSFAVGFENGTISLYKTASWEKKHTLSIGLPAAVKSVVFSPNGQQIASDSGKNMVQLWDAQTGEPGAILNGHTGCVMSVVFSPNGQQIASGSDDKTVRLWDAQTSTPGAILSGHSDFVRSVVFSPDGQQIATGSDDCTVRLWDAQTGASGAILRGHTDYVMSVAFSPSGQQIASGSRDRTVRLWEVRTGAPGAILRGHTNWVMSVVFSPSGEQIASGSEDKTVRLWDAQTGAPGAILSGHTTAVVSVVFSPSGQQIASGSLDKTVRLWGAQTGEPGASLSGLTDEVNCVVFSPDGQQVASGSDDKAVQLWDAQTGSSGAILSGHTSYVYTVAFSPSGRQIASGSDDETVQLWDAQTGTPGAVLSGHTDWVRSVVFSPNGQLIASGSYDNTVRLWDAQTGASGAILSGHTSYVYSVAFSPSGQQIASGSEDKTVRFWDAQTGAPGAILSGHTAAVMCVVFSPSGQQIASGGVDGTIRLWDAQTGTPGAILGRHIAAVRSVVFSPNGHQIASGSNDKTVQLWDVESGRCLTVVNGFHRLVASVAWITNGDDGYLATGCYDKSVRLWKVTGDCHHVCLQWSSGHDRLFVSDTNIQNTQGLSRTNIKLLVQRGSVGQPIPPCEDAEGR